MVRPCRQDTRFFKRELRPDQRAIILAAGQGDITQGFNELLALYAHLHHQGYRPDMGVESVGFVSNDSQLLSGLDE